MTGLFSTAYFPPIAYMAALMHCDNVIIEAKETFPKQTYRNRMQIVTAGGLRILSVPTIRTNHSRTDQVEIDYKDRWPIIHLRTLDAAYAASPYYMYFRDDIATLLHTQHDNLLSLNQSILRWLLSKLKINCNVSVTTQWQANTNEGTVDLRNIFSPKVPYPTDNYPQYYQVFADRMPFQPNLTILDLLFNLGPEAHEHLHNIPQTAIK